MIKVDLELFYGIYLWLWSVNNLDFCLDFIFFYFGLNFLLIDLDFFLHGGLDFFLFIDYLDFFILDYNLDFLFLHDGLDFYLIDDGLDFFLIDDGIDFFLILEGNL
jgi:hypothetical protein